MIPLSICVTEDAQVCSLYVANDKYEPRVVGRNLIPFGEEDGKSRLGSASSRDVWRVNFGGYYNLLVEMNGV